MVSTAEYEIYSMVNRRQQVNIQDCKDNFPPLEVIDVEQDLADENLAESLVKLRYAVNNFLDSYSGVTVTAAVNNNINKMM